jgi:hypothetical protein
MNGEMSDGKSFALFIETACEEFRILDSLIEGKTKIVTSDPRDFRTPGSIQMALARSFVFDVARAYRICEHGRVLEGNPGERKSFLKYIKDIKLVEVRGVNEHGFDAGNAKRGRQKHSKPCTHAHDLEGVRIGIDETSLFIGKGKVLMGPLNLYDVYERVEKMRQIAGFTSCRSELK